MLNLVVFFFLELCALIIWEGYLLKTIIRETAQVNSTHYLIRSQNGGNLNDIYLIILFMYGANVYMLLGHKMKS